jgi:hypothetical protein
VYLGRLQSDHSDTSSANAGNFGASRALRGGAAPPAPRLVFLLPSKYSELFYPSMQVPRSSAPAPSVNSRLHGRLSPGAPPLRSLVSERIEHPTAGAFLPRPVCLDSCEQRPTLPLTGSFRDSAPFLKLPGARRVPAYPNRFSGSLVFRRSNDDISCN